MVQTSNKNALKKTGYLGLPQKGQEQVTDLQRNALTSPIHFVQFYNKVN